MNVIEINNVSKKFKLAHEKHGTIKEAITSIFKRKDSKQEFWALKDISLNIEKGQSVGIIGPNGSGKSTLLKLITNIIKPTKGEVKIVGEVSGLLELGAGFHPDLTGRENIYLNGAILGFKKKDIDAKYDEIVKFAELEEFIDTPVKHYSSGMYMRLGFSIAINVNPDIMLIDEVFAVGDQNFQNKCLNKINEFKMNKGTIIIVSHSLEQIKRICGKAVFTYKGEIKEQGEPEIVIHKYNEFMREILVISGNKPTEKDYKKVQRWGTKEIEIQSVRILDKSSNEKNVYYGFENMVVEINYKAKEKILNPTFGVAIFKDDGTYVYGTNTYICDIKIGEVYGKKKIQLELSPLQLLQGDYMLTICVCKDNDMGNPYDYFHNAFKFKVLSKDSIEGVVRLNGIWRY